VQSKAARVNFDWPDARAAWLKVEEEIREAAEAWRRATPGASARSWAMRSFPS